jgi:hypothetical protein
MIADGWVSFEGETVVRSDGLLWYPCSKTAKNTAEVK